MELDVRRMLLLAEVAHRGSLTGAAQVLNYTPSAVSQQIRRLEDEAGQPLLERSAKGVTLTDGGATVVRHAERIARHLRAARAELEAISGLRAGVLEIGSFPTVSSSLLPLVVTRFTAAHEGVHLEVRSGVRAQLIEMLHSRTVQLAMLWDYDWDRLADDALCVVHLCNDPMALIVAKGHPLASRSAVSLEEVATEPWVSRNASHPLAEVLERICRSNGVAPRIAFEAHGVQEAQAMVAAGLGIALAPRLALTNLRSDVRILSIDPSLPARRILLARLAERQPSPAAVAIKRVFQDVSQTWGAVWAAGATGGCW